MDNDNFQHSKEEKYVRVKNIKGKSAWTELYGKEIQSQQEGWHIADRLTSAVQGLFKRGAYPYETVISENLRDYSHIALEEKAHYLNERYRTSPMTNLLVMKLFGTCKWHSNCKFRRVTSRRSWS